MVSLLQGGRWSCSSNLEGGRSVIIGCAGICWAEGRTRGTSHTRRTSTCTLELYGTSYAARWACAPPCAPPHFYAERPTCAGTGAGAHTCSARVNHQTPWPASPQVPAAASCWAWRSAWRSPSSGSCPETSISRCATCTDTLANASPSVARRGRAPCAPLAARHVPKPDLCSSTLSFTPTGRWACTEDRQPLH
jgi:hypothetical protein